MKEFFTGNYGIGIISGIISGIFVSVFIWLIQYFSKKIGIIIPSDFNPNTQKITITNKGKVKVQGFEIRGLISFEEEGRMKFYFIKIDNQLTYISQRVLSPKDNRIYDIGVTGCIDNHDFHTFQEVRNTFNDTKLTVFVNYYGKYTNTLKRFSKDF